MADSTHESIRRTNAAVAGEADESLPQRTASGVVYQSVAQSMAIAVADASDMLRNVQTIATTAMGVAMAQMLECPENPAYPEMVRTAMDTITEAGRLWQDIARSARDLLTTLPSDSSETSSPTLPLPPP